MRFFSGIVKLRLVTVSSILFDSARAPHSCAVFLYMKRGARVRIELAIAYREHKGGAGNWLLYRVGGEREQHCHFHKLRDAEYVRDAIIQHEWPEQSFFRGSVARLLTESELLELGVELIDHIGYAAGEDPAVRKKSKKKRQRREGRGRKSRGVWIPSTYRGR